MTRREREVTDINDILQIINETKILHLGLSDEGWPYVVPMNYGYEYVDGKLTFISMAPPKGTNLMFWRRIQKSHLLWRQI